VHARGCSIADARPSIRSIRAGSLELREFRGIDWIQVATRVSVVTLEAPLIRRLNGKFEPKYHPFKRLAVATCFALLAGLVSWRAQYVAHAGGSDHVILQRAAQIFVSGGDPYQIGSSSHLPTLFWRFFYPLPSIVLGFPFMWLDPERAAIGFIVCSAFLLGFALTRDGLERVPIAFSVSFITAVQFAQSSPLILALALVPATRALSMLKPNLGLAVFAWKPAWRHVFVAVALFTLPLIVWPDWPRRWLISVRSSPMHHAPAMVGVGALALLSALRWRRPEARLLFAMTIVPHGLYFYDDLPLWLIAQTRRDAIALTVCSWLGWLAWNITSTGPRVIDMQPWVTVSLYVPALIMVLARPNEGEVPIWLEQAIRWAPTWLRGSAPVAASAETSVG
jgi:hypothetical protein